VGGRSADRDYVRFVETTLGLADATAALPRRARFGMAVAILRAFESDREARTALALHEAERLERAVVRLRFARAGLDDAGRDALDDARRRRMLSAAA